MSYFQFAFYGVGLIMVFTDFYCKYFATICNKINKYHVSIMFHYMVRVEDIEQRWHHLRFTS